MNESYSAEYFIKLFNVNTENPISDSIGICKDSPMEIIEKEISKFGSALRPNEIELILKNLQKELAKKVNEFGDIENRWEKAKKEWISFFNLKIYGNLKANTAGNAISKHEPTLRNESSIFSLTIDNFHLNKFNFGECVLSQTGEINVLVEMHSNYPVYLPMDHVFSRMYNKLLKDFLNNNLPEYSLVICQETLNLIQDRLNEFSILHPLKTGLGKKENQDNICRCEKLVFGSENKSLFRKFFKILIQYRQLEENYTLNAFKQHFEFVNPTKTLRSISKNKIEKSKINWIGDLVQLKATLELLQDCGLIGDELRNELILVRFGFNGNPINLESFESSDTSKVENSEFYSKLSEIFQKQSLLDY